MITPPPAVDLDQLETAKPARRCVYCGSEHIDLWASWNVAGEWTCAECTPTDGGS